MDKELEFMKKLRNVYQDGKKEGIKEVVDWLNQDSNTLEIEVGGGIARVIDRYAWQAQLKEWGISP